MGVGWNIEALSVLHGPCGGRQLPFAAFSHPTIDIGYRELINEIEYVTTR